MTPQEAQDTGVIIEVAVAASIETVWRSLRDRESIRRWHGWYYQDAEGADALDPEISEIFFDNAVEDEGAYVLRISGGDEFRLRGNGDATTVTITRPPRAEVGPDWADYYDGITEGWQSFLQQLRFALERHPGEDRRTLFLSAENVTVSPRDALGLGQVRPGERFTAAAGEDFVLDGEVWSVAEHQCAVTLDDYGPGLLIVADMPEQGSPPVSGAMAIVTTYGQGDTDFERIRRQWSTWWVGLYPDAADAAS